ncbi:MAG: cell division ATP-binding protein FtsE [Minwuia sp.]|uniref:cell division ATP-binding protein FtsE n=1 Tax=Minwuia sp. TaxID=2493630 RepID=UPI003A875B2F
MTQLSGSSGSGPLVSLRNIGLRYGDGPEVLRDLDLDLPAGSFHFLTGRSGAGKSSLLSLLQLARRPSRGLMRMFGADVNEAPATALPAMRRRVGVVFQDFRLLNHLTAAENVVLPLKLAGGLSDEKSEQFVREMLAWVGLADQADALPATLSGGEKQRIAIARAVIAGPKLLLADEPTGNVDRDMAERLMTLFIRLNQLGTTVMVATHDSELTSRFGFPILHLEDGRLHPASAAQP